MLVGPAVSEVDSALQLYLGVDAVWPFVQFEPYLGIQSGFALAYPHRNVLPAMHLRGGCEMTRLRPFVWGIEIAYGLLGANFTESHWVELHVRGGFAF